MPASFHTKPRGAGPAHQNNLRPFKADPHALQELRRKLAFEPPGMPVARMSDEQLLTVHARRVREWHHGEPKRRNMALDLTAGPAEAEQSSTSSEERMKESDKTFFAIEAVDGRGEPVPSLKYKVKLPDGSTREGKLDDKGKAHLSGVDPGTCELSFPELHGTDWAM